MQLNNASILLIGAAGGIGRHMAARLASAGARLCLTGLFQQQLQDLQEHLGDRGNTVCTLVADITSSEDRERCVQTMVDRFGGIDILINLAGINAFARFEEQTPDDIEKIMMVNAVVPMLMTRAVLPLLLAQQKGQIVNVGSTFGSIGFSCFTTYSTSKFALRGFSQALRRELVDSNITVTYVAPRAVDTPLNPPAVYEMAKEIKMSFDQPEYVAEKIIQAIEQDKKEKYIGFPESLFARINGILPNIVDGSLKKQNSVMRDYAKKDSNT